MTAAYFLLILRAFGAGSRAHAALLDGTALSPSELPGREITLGQQLRQLHNANRLLEPGWALAMGAQLHAATHGPMGTAVVSARTLRDGVDVMTRFSHVRSPHFRLSAMRSGDEVRLTPAERVALAPDERRVLLDIVMLSTQGLVEAALGRPMHEARVELSYPAPRYARRYDDVFHAPVRFGCETSAIVIPAGWLDVACPLADGMLHRTAVRVLTAGARRLQGPGAFAAQVEQIVAARGDELGVEAAAGLLHVSRRTLSRRLRTSGVTYRTLRDGQRRDHAETLLRETTLDVAEVAYAVGYEDAANFGRACRRWFGMSPGAYRRHLAGARRS